MLPLLVVPLGVTVRRIVVSTMRGRSLRRRLVVRKRSRRSLRTRSGLRGGLQPPGLGAGWVPLRGRRRDASATVEAG